MLNYETWKEGKSVIFLGAVIGNARVAVERNISKTRSTYEQLYNKLFSTTVRINCVFLSASSKPY